MSVKERKISKSDLVDGYISKCKKRIEELKKDLDPDHFEDVEQDDEKKKKKSETKHKKTYKVILKVAAVIGLFFLVSFIYSSLFFPNFIDAVIVLFRDLIPSFDDSAGMEHFVN